jgi:hypothetical protein
MTAAMPQRNPDTKLLLLGVQFDHSFERYLRLISETNKVREECEGRLETFGVPRDSERWHRLLDITCSGWQDAARDAGDEVEALSRQIGAISATTVPGLLIKAKCLPFDIVERPNEDRNAEILHAFVDEIEAVAYGPTAR